MVHASLLKQRIVLQKPTVTKNSHNEKIKTYADEATVPAQVIVASEREYFTADRLMEEDRAVFRIRFRDDVKSDWRLLYNDRTWNIRGVREEGRRKSLMITATNDGN